MGLRDWLKHQNQPTAKDRIVGRWRLIRSEGNIEIGEGITITFTNDGKLVYCIERKDHIQVINLVYSMSGDRIITDQPSAPREARTKFTIDGEGNLMLDYGDGKA